MIIIHNEEEWQRYSKDHKVAGHPEEFPTVICEARSDLFVSFKKEELKKVLEEMELPAILPCRVCGFVPPDGFVGLDQMYCITCPQCDGRLYKDKKDAIEHWNRRNT